MEFCNKELDRAFEFISHADFDIFCLQEVPEEFLERLKTLSYRSVYAPESNLVFRGKRGTIFNVVLSKYPIVHSEIISLKHYTPELPWRSRLFARCMFLLRIWPEGLGNRHALYADIGIPDRGVVRIFNLHLPLMNPHIRAEEFEHSLLQKNPSQPTIVCGDFNIIEKSFTIVLNWILGGKITDTLCYRRERNHFEKRFATYKLLNALHGKMTHPLSRSQLDHILVSNSFSIKNVGVISDRAGSDHCPIHAEIQ
ncbi:MAG: endonuclease/exonuclease/phosphatase family protein [Candidatus Paceibacterota bacterium]|jgi:endonuclease/exonuclease/phosphatase family metal-dependent hydrolase